MNTLKKLLAVLLAAIMLLSLFPFTVMADDEPAVDGDGYYNIYTADQLYWFVAAFNSGKGKTNNIKIMNDIVVNEGNMTRTTKSAREWVPIGGAGYTISDRFGFYGIIDGCGHTISGLFCNDANSAALVGFNHGTIKNLGIINSYFYGSMDDYTDTSHSAPFAGVNFEYSNINNCYSVNNVIMGDYLVGGIAAASYGGSTVENCYSYNTYGGKMQSYIDAITYKFDSPNVRNIYYYAEANKGSNCKDAVAFGADWLSSGELTYLLNNSSSGIESVWRQNLNCGERDFMPVINSSHYIVYKDGTSFYNKEDDSSVILPDDSEKLEPNADGIYELYNVDQLYAFATLVNDNNDNKGLSAILMEDITISYERLTSQNVNARTWVPIGGANAAYTGTFDGNYHTISGVYFDEVGREFSYQGVFGYLDKGAVIKNLGVINSYSYATDSAGIIAGVCSNSTIENCYSSCNVVKSEGNAGAIVGSVIGESKLKDLVCVDCLVFSDEKDVKVGPIAGLFNPKTNSWDTGKSTAENCYYYRLDDTSNVNTNWDGIQELIKGDADLNGVVDLRDAICVSANLDVPIGTFAEPALLAADWDENDYVDYYDAFALLVHVSDLEGKL